MLLRMPICFNLEYLTEAIVQFLNHLKGTLLLLLFVFPNQTDCMIVVVGLDWTQIELTKAVYSHTENNAGNQVCGLMSAFRRMHLFASFLTNTDLSHSNSTYN